MDNEGDPKEGFGIDFPNHGRIAGIDFGTVRIGVALTDPDRILASRRRDPPTPHKGRGVGRWRW